MGGRLSLIVTCTSNPTTLNSKRRYHITDPLLSLPGNRSVRLLEQKVPASYVHLQDVVGILAEERIKQGKDPVLHTEQYK